MASTHGPDFSNEQADAGQQAKRLPAATLLFQAPDLTPAPRPEPVEEPEPRSGRGGRKSTKNGSEEASEPAETQPADSDSTEPAEDKPEGDGARRRRRGGRGKRKGAAAEETPAEQTPAPEEEPAEAAQSAEEEDAATSRRRRRTRSRTRSADPKSEVSAVEGSTRLEAKRQRRREGREAGRRRQVITEAEFLARRESVDRKMVVREKDGLNQIAVLEDGILVEHYVARRTQTSMVGNVYLGRVQNVLPGMEAAFVDLGKGRNAVLYAGEVNWDAAGMEGQPRRIEQALKSGDTVLVQVTKDPIGHKGARLTSQITLAGRHLVLVPSGAMTGISRKLPESERGRLKKILKEIVPDGAGVIVRTAAEGATEDQLRDDIDRLVKIWKDIEAKAANTKSAPALLKGEPELAVRVVRDVFNEDFSELIVQGPDAWKTISKYVSELSPELADRMTHWVKKEDVFSQYRVDEQLAKGMDRKVWLPSGGYLIIDRTEAMTVIDVNTGRFTGTGGSLEETVTRNNLEAAEEIVRQLRLRDIGGIIVIDFIDMVLESNRDLVLRRVVECLGRDRTRHQVAEVTSLGLVQMTRKRVGMGLVEAFSEPCSCCGGRGIIVHDAPVEKGGQQQESGNGKRRRGKQQAAVPAPSPAEEPASRPDVRAALATIAAAAAQAHDDDAPETHDDAPAVVQEAPTADMLAPEPEPEPELEPEPEPEPEPERPRRRGGRRRAVASGAVSAAPDEGIIALPVPKESAPVEPPVSIDKLADIIFPGQAHEEDPVGEDPTQ